MNNDKITVRELEFEKFNLVTSKGEYILELDNESIKIADKMNLLNKLSDMGIQEILSSLIYIFSIKNRRDFTPNLANKVVDTIIADEEYDIAELASELIDELALRYQQVFTSKGKKKLQRM